MKKEKSVRSLRKRLHQLAQERQSWDTHWLELEEYILPYGNSFLQKGRKRNDGGKRNQRIIDATATRALETLASGIQGGLTPKAIPWFSLANKNNEMMDRLGVRKWLQETTNLYLEIFSKSNFYHVMSSIYKDLALYGTAVLYAEDDMETTLTFKHLPIGSYYLASSENNRTHTIYREFSLTAETCIKTFGIENVSEDIKSLAEQNPDSWVDIIHSVYPRDTHSDKNIFSNFPYRSVYFEKNSNEDTCLQDSGYRYFPFLVVRFETHGENVYGYGPGMRVLGDVKELMVLQEDKRDIVAKISNPPMLADASLQHTQLSTADGGVSYINQLHERPAFVPAYQVPYDIRPIQMVIGEVQQAIREGFYNDLFRLFTGEDKLGVTATEVLERRQERLTQLGPALDRLQSELFGPLMDILFERCKKMNLLKDIPEELLGNEIAIEYTSVLAQAQKTAGAGGLQQFLSFVRQISTEENNLLDVLDLEQSIKNYADLLGISPDVLRSKQELMAIRKQRAEEMKMAQITNLSEKYMDKLGGTLEK